MMDGTHLTAWHQASWTNIYALGGPLCPSRFSPCPPRPRLRPWAVAARLLSATIIPFVKKVDLNRCEPGTEPGLKADCVVTGGTQ